MTMRRFSIALALTAFLCASGAQALQDTDELTATVTRLAHVGSCGSPSFSPDGRRLAVLCNLSGTPQVWIISSGGGWPTQGHPLEDPVIGVEWSPSADRLALSVAPGGGMNTQIYLVHPDGTGFKRYSQGGKDNNWLAHWTHSGSAL